MGDRVSDVPDNWNPLTTVSPNELQQATTLPMQRDKKVIPVDVAAEWIDAEPETPIGDLRQRIEHAPDVGVDRRQVIVEWLAKYGPSLAASHLIVSLEPIESRAWRMNA